MVLFWKTKIRKIKENLRFSNISMQNSLKNLDSREELTKNYLVAQLWSVVIFFDPPATLRGKQGKYYLQFGDQRRFRFREKWELTSIRAVLTAAGSYGVCPL